MKRRPELLAFAALASVVGLALAMQPGNGTKPASKPSAGEARGGFAIRGARAFDGERDLGVAIVLVRAGRTQAVAADAAVPEGSAAVEGIGKARHRVHSRRAPHGAFEFRIGGVELR